MTEPDSPFRHVELARIREGASDLLREASRFKEPIESSYGLAEATG